MLGTLPAERGEGGFFPGAFRGISALPHLGFKRLASRTAREYTSVVSGHLVCGNLPRQPRGTNASVFRLPLRENPDACVGLRDLAQPPSTSPPGPLTAASPLFAASGPLHLLFPLPEQSSPLLAYVASPSSRRAGPASLHRPLHSSPGTPWLFPAQSDLSVHLNN